MIAPNFCKFKEVNQFTDLSAVNYYNILDARKCEQIKIIQST